MTTRITTLALAAALVTGIATGAQAAQTQNGGFDKASHIGKAVPAFGVASTTGSHVVAQPGEKVHNTHGAAAFGISLRSTDQLATLPAWLHGR